MNFISKIFLFLFFASTSFLASAHSYEVTVKEVIEGEVIYGTQEFQFYVEEHDRPYITNGVLNLNPKVEPSRFEKPPFKYYLPPKVGDVLVVEQVTPSYDQPIYQGTDIYYITDDSVKFNFKFKDSGVQLVATSKLSEVTLTSSDRIVYSVGSYTPNLKDPRGPGIETSGVELSNGVTYVDYIKMDHPWGIYNNLGHLNISPSSSIENGLYSTEDGLYVDLSNGNVYSIRYSFYYTATSSGLDRTGWKYGSGNQQMVPYHDETGHYRLFYLGKIAEDKLAF